MKRLGIVAVGLALVLALATAAVFAIWPVVGDAPWESEATCARPSASPCPSSSQEETEKIACLQGGGDWIYATVDNINLRSLCGRQSTGCWACYHR
jgi:hypothetical protein